MTPTPDPTTSPSVSRRAVLGGVAAASTVAVLHPPPALAGPPRSARTTEIVDWIDRTARPLRGTDPALPWQDLHPLGRIAGRASILGLGESAHGTDDQFVLKHRITRYLVECHGFRTLAWEEAWGSGVAIDRYVCGGPGDPSRIVADAGFNLQNAAMLELMDWLRHHNLRRAPRRRVRFLGADVVQLREVQFTELEQHVAAVDPARTPALLRHLEPLRIQDNPGFHIYWYRQLSPAVQQELIGHARAVNDIVRRLPRRPSPVSVQDAALHALTLLGFYESYTADGERTDTRDAYIAEILRRWRRTHRDPIIYSAANAHTAAAPTQLVSFPPDPPTTRALVGGRLRATYGHDYVSIGITFDHGAIRAGWDTGRPRVFPVPVPPKNFVDHVLGQVSRGEYLLGLQGCHRGAVGRWLDHRGKLRVIGGAGYDPSHDRAYSMTLDPWGPAFDALVHLDTVRASRLP